jgi:glutamate-1-semialdehyde 2,1-aminomutase
VTVQATLAARYSQKYPRSSHESARLRSVMAGDATHDGWRLEPFGILTEKAEGALKWTIDDQQVIDYWMGHGSLLCGHAFAPVVNAVLRQARIGLHYGGPHPLQIRWAELVTQLVPGAESVRFTASGTEGTLLAFRVARAFTGRKVIIKLDGHFHGWHDGAMSHFTSSDTAGFDSSSTEEVRLAPHSDVDKIRQLLDSNVAGIILEPGGGGSGALPWSCEFLHRLQAMSRENGSLLIFDETVSGFRYAPGGVQSISGVIPELTVLGKILTGGLPGGAVAGLREVMEVFGKGTAREGRTARVPHTGTSNGNPLSAAAGSAMLEQVHDGSHQRRAHDAAKLLVSLVNDEASREKLDVNLFQQGGVFHIMIGAAQHDLPSGPSEGAVLLPRLHPEYYRCLRLALLIHGVDSHPVHGWVSSAHSSDVIDETARAFGAAFRDLKQQSLLPCS